MTWAHTSACHLANLPLSFFLGFNEYDSLEWKKKYIYFISFLIWHYLGKISLTSRASLENIEKIICEQLKKIEKTKQIDFIKGILYIIKWLYKYLNQQYLQYNMYNVRLDKHLVTFRRPSNVFWFFNGSSIPILVWYFISGSYVLNRVEYCLC